MSPSSRHLALVLCSRSFADPIDIAATRDLPASRFTASSPDARTSAPFDWRGGMTLTSPDDEFGGLSGLVLSDDCEALLAVSDEGRWFTAALDL